MHDHLLFNGWDLLWRMAVVGICSYLFLILLLRAAGKRTLSRMNAYDMVVTMALGSILAKVLLTHDNSLSESIFAMFLLIGLQYAVSVAMCRVPWIRAIVSCRPAILYHHNQYIEPVMKRERVRRDEIQAAMHARGIPDIALVDTVILGANGDLSVLLKEQAISRIPINSPTSEGNL